VNARDLLTVWCCLLTAVGPPMGHGKPYACDTGNSAGILRDRYLSLGEVV
jgi:hypothetical protein